MARQLLRQVNIAGIFPINKRRKIGAIDFLYIYFTV